MKAYEQYVLLRGKWVLKSIKDEPSVLATAILRYKDCEKNMISFLWTVAKAYNYTLVTNQSSVIKRRFEVGVVCSDRLYFGDFVRKNKNMNMCKDTLFFPIFSMIDILSREYKPDAITFDVNSSFAVPDIESIEKYVISVYSK